MLSVDLGAGVALTWTSAAAGSAALAITAPDTTAVTPPAVTNTGATHTATFVPAMPGRYLIRWTQAGEAYTDIVDVWPTDPRFLISLAEARAALKKTVATPADDDVLRLFIAAATPIIEDICGPILAGQRTQTTDGSEDTILLGDSDVSGVVVTVDGVVDTTPTVKLGAGIVTSAGPSFGGSVVVVTYTVGGGVTPFNIRLATAELVRVWTQVGRQGNRPSSQTSDASMSWTPSGFAVPKRVIELCAPNARLGGFG